jgi:hypothetical protein
VPAGQQQAVEGGWVQRLPRLSAGELRGLGQLGVEPLGLGCSAQLPEDHPGQEPGIGGRHRAGPLGGEGDLVPRIAQHPPRHRHLGHVEIPVGERNQHTHPAIIAQTPPREPASPDPTPYSAAGGSGWIGAL